MPAMLDLLYFEDRWGFTHPHKEEAIRVEFEITPARYYRLLGRIIDTREALEARPMLVLRGDDRSDLVIVPHWSGNRVLSDLGDIFRPVRRKVRFDLAGVDRGDR